MTDPTNPFEPPGAAIIGPAGLAPPAGPRSRWLPLRWLPMIVLGTFAASLWVLAAAIVGRLGWVGWALRGARGPSRTWFIEGSCAAAGALFLGSLSFLAARSWYACRWKRAVMLTLLYAAAVAAVVAIGPPS